MPHEWIKQIRDARQLTVFNKATTWAVPVAAAIKTFNALSFGVTLVTTEREEAANIVLVLGMRGGQQYPHDVANYGSVTASTKPNFDPTGLHGVTHTFRIQRSVRGQMSEQEMFFAGVFLPGKIKKATNGQKEMVAVHELIHAAGLGEWHDTEGIMYDFHNIVPGGLLEARYDDAGSGVKPMPPIRVGGETKRLMRNL